MATFNKGSFLCFYKSSCSNKFVLSVSENNIWLYTSSLALFYKFPNGLCVWFIVFIYQEEKTLDPAGALLLLGAQTNSKHESGGR